MKYVKTIHINLHYCIKSRHELLFLSCMPCTLWLVSYFLLILLLSNQVCCVRVRTHTHKHIYISSFQRAHMHAWLLRCAKMTFTCRDCTHASLSLVGTYIFYIYVSNYQDDFYKIPSTSKIVYNFSNDAKVIFKNNKKCGRSNSNCINLSRVR